MTAKPNQIEAFRLLNKVTAAPMFACFKAVAGAYRDFDIETLMVLAWTAFRWQRDGKIPRPDERPTITFPEVPR